MLIPDTMRLGQLFYHINKKMIVTQNNNLSDLGLTLQQALVIAYIYREKNKKITQRMLEKGLNNTNPTIMNIVKVMMGKNLIYKIQDSLDRRKFYLYLTPIALDLAPKCIKRLDETDKDIYKCLTVEEVQTLKKILEKINVK